MKSSLHGKKNRAERLIYHITTRPQWQAAQQAGVYHIASLESDGFIHCSFLHQVLPSARRHFAGQPDLLVLGIDPDRLNAELRIERGTDSPQDFPHIYGEVNLDAVVEVTPLDPAHPAGFDLTADPPA